MVRTLLEIVFFLIIFPCLKETTCGIWLELRSQELVPEGKKSLYLILGLQAPWTWDPYASIGISLGYRKS